jgi:hypothetical protein
VPRSGGPQIVCAAALRVTAGENQRKTREARTDPGKGLDQPGMILKEVETRDINNVGPHPPHDSDELGFILRERRHRPGTPAGDVDEAVVDYADRCFRHIHVFQQGPFRVFALNAGHVRVSHRPRDHPLQPDAPDAAERLRIGKELMRLDEEQLPALRRQRQDVAGTEPQIYLLSRDDAGQGRLLEPDSPGPHLRSPGAENDFDIRMRDLEGLVPRRSEELEMPFGEDRRQTEQQILHVRAHPANRQR